MSDSRARRREIVGLTLALVAAMSLFAAVKPHAPDPDTPLPWDAAGHYLRALEFRDALRSFSPTAVKSALLSPDLYPFGHPLALGIWLSLVGESGTGAFLFLLLTLWSCVFGVWLCCRQAPGNRLLCFAGAVAVLLSSAPLIGLSASYMVETFAVGASLFGLAAITWALESDLGPSRWLRALRIAAVAGGVAAPLLTKYNIGLPIAVAGLGTSLWDIARGRPRRGWPVLGGTLLGLALWALYLSAQQDGWRSFLEFARNRANSVGWAPLARLGWYAQLFVHEFAGGWPVALGIGLLAAVGFARHRTALTAASGLALVAGLGALSVHPYLLDRSLVGPSALLAIPAGLGLAAVAGLPRAHPRARRAVAGSLLALAVVAVILAIPRGRIWARRLDDPSLAKLGPLSRFVASSFGETGDCRVVGCFNEFSLGWARILWRRTHRADAPALAGDFAYPLAESRWGLDSRPDSAYSALARGWASARNAEDVLAIQVREGSRWDTQDYRLWNRWKLNEVDALASLPGMRQVARFTSEDGSVQASLLRLGPDLVTFGRGWGPAEPWGRWALARVAELRIGPLTAPSRLVLRVAAFEGLGAAQECTVRVDGKVAGTFSVSGPTWQWRDVAVTVPESRPDHVLSVSLDFARLDPGHPGDPILRALPFESVRVESAPGELGGRRGRRL